MKKIINKIFVKLFCGLCFLMIMGGLCTKETVFGYNNPEPELYEFGKDSGFPLDAGTLTEDNFSYGADSIGTFSLSGDVVQEKTYSGYTAYGISGEVSFVYTYMDQYHKKNKEEWNLYSDSQKMVAGLQLKEKMKEGVIIVQKSADGKTWELVAEPVYDALKEDSKERILAFYTPSEEEIKQGTYYRIYVAYTMRREIGKDKLFLGIEQSKFEYKNFLEKYEFYVCSENNFVVLRDCLTENLLTSVCSVSSGFYIEKNSSTDEVIVKYNSKNMGEVQDYDFFTEPGLYQIEIKTKLGKKYSYMVTVTDGLYALEVEPDVYECEEKTGFVYENGVKKPMRTSFGIPSYTTLLVAQSAEFITKEAAHFNMNGTAFDAYGISGDSVRLFLRLNYPLKSADGWKIVDSAWGEKEKQKVCGVETGEIGTGALIVQTSKTGIEGSWQDVSKNRYAKGLYTTDCGTNYAAGEEFLVYTPAGDDVLEGIYVRVLYAYQVKHGKETIDCVEKYECYLCNNALGMVTFHNLSLDGKIEELYGEEDESTLKVYKNAESLPSGAGTVTGFSIDKGKNLTIQYTVEKNGQSVEVPENKTFTETGKYDIHLTSAVGDKKDVTIYVDTSTNEQALYNYFGTGFLKGKRIYAEGEYPVYEGGETTYHLEAVEEEYLPISGNIKNVDTGEVIELGVSREARSGVITSAGNYVARFMTGMEGKEGQPGDARVFEFRFRIIPEGTAPGPVVNQQNLAEYVCTNISDAYPVYYGVTYPSAMKGYITLAFKKKEDAIRYAVAYEQGIVENVDGQYRYSGSLNVKQKEKYDSAWDLADATYYFAEQAVERAYFDLSEKFSYLTLEESVLAREDNLRKLELNNSVVIFADGQREQCMVSGTLPIISEKSYAYVEPGTDGAIKTGKHDFQFVKDKHGYDSNHVRITDCNGKIYLISYNKGVGRQLADAGCPSGIVTITEETVYGDTVSYQAAYIREGENTAKVSILYYDDDQEMRMVLGAENDGLCLETDAFSLEKIEDELAPFSLVMISKDGQELVFSGSDQVQKEAWSEPGTYRVRVVNRLGFDFSFEVVVRESIYAVIEFSGEGTEELKNMITTAGEKNVMLPELSRYGYELAGYESESGLLFAGQMEEVPFVSDTVLTAKWVPKQVMVILKDNEGRILEERWAAYGAEIALGIPSVEEGFVFAAWMRDGVSLENNELLIDSEEPITVQYMVEVVEAEEPEEAEVLPTPTVTETPAEEETEAAMEEEAEVNQANDGQEEKKGGKGWIVAIVILVIVIIVGIAAWWLLF